MLFKFKKPYVFEGESFDSVELDFDSLTGKDLQVVESEFVKTGNTAVVASLNQTYQAILAARAAKKPSEFILNLPAKDYSRITLEVQNFLFSEA